MAYHEFEEKAWRKGALIVFRNHRREVIGVDFESGWIQTRTRYTRRKIWVYYGDCELLKTDNHEKVRQDFS